MTEARLEALQQVADERLTKIIALEAELRRIKRDANILCDCKCDRAGFELLGRVLNAAIEVIDQRERAADNLGVGATRELTHALDILTTLVSLHQGDGVSEGDYLDGYGGLPTGPTREEYEADRADMMHSDGERVGLRRDL